MTVTAVGLGSVGSPLVLGLVRSGIINFNLIEFDTVSLSNLCRSPYDLFDIGRSKGDCIYEKALVINPCVNFKIHKENVLEMDQDILSEIIDSSDIIIDSTDSTRTKALINGLAHDTKPVIYPSVYNLGKGGDILFTLPGLPCYECVFKSIMSEIKDIKHSDWDYSTDQAKPMPSLLSDIQVIVARAVKIALAILTGNTEKSFIEKITEPGYTLL